MTILKQHVTTSRLSVAVLAILIVGYSTAPVFAAQQVSTNYSMPVHLQMSPSASDCENSPGPNITLNGELALSGIEVQLIFRNNVKGTHTHVEETTASVVVIPAGESIQFPKQPVLGGVGGNPFIWIQFMDSKGNALTDELFLGRCVQGLSELDADFAIPTSLVATATADSCSNKASFITLTGELALEGLDAKLIFRNNDNPVGGPHEHDEEASTKIVIIPEGQSIQFPKQPPLGGVGGNPWISLRFLDENDQLIGQEFLLGRCVQDF